MSNAQFYPHGGMSNHNTREIVFSFLSNNTSDPSLTSVVGVGTGTGVSAMVKTLTHSATGKITVALSNDRGTCKAVLYASAELEDLSSDDGAYCTIGPISNEATNTGLSFPLFLRAATGTKTDYTNRRVFVRLVIRDTAAGVP